MSILKSIIDSVKSAISNEAFEQVKAREMHDKIVAAIKEVSADGTITAEELTEVKGLLDKLNFSESEFQHLKFEILKNLISQITKDNKVTEEEMSLYNEVADSLKVAEDEINKLKQDVGKMMNLYKGN